MSRRTAIYVGVGSLLLVIAMAGSMTYWFGLTKPVTKAGPAQTLCEDAVRRDLLNPSDASFHDDYVKRDRMSEDDDATLGADAAQVREVWAVGGDVASPGKSGRMAQSQFMCRAYLFDGQPPRTQVNFAASDEDGQRSVHP